MIVDIDNEFSVRGADGSEILYCKIEYTSL
jgi:hypothetical protein